MDNRPITPRPDRRAAGWGAHRGRFTLVCAAAFAATLLCRAAEREVFRADFSGAKSLEALGWEILSGPDQSEYEASDDVLRVTCHQNWHNGGLIRKRIPVVKKGVLDFEANIVMENASNALGVALTLGVYNISTWYHDYCKDWRRYFPEGPSKRLPGYSIEPVGHKRLTPVKKHEWARYRIVFDHESGTVEYYRNDMGDPVHIDYDAPVLGRDEYEGGYLRIGSMGLTKGTVVYGVRNLVLSENVAESAAKAARDKVLLFQGIASDRYALAPAAAAACGKENVRAYTLRAHGAAVSPTNQLKLDKLPSGATVQTAAKVLLIDMPIQPGDCLPPMFLKQVVGAVFDGADLVVFGGMFTLGKGGYAGSILERVLPVQLKGTWEVKRLRTMTPLADSKGALGAGHDRPGVLWRHDLTPTEDAEVLLTAGGKPMFVRRPFGAGTVSVFLGAPCGGTDGAGLTPFWESRAWQDWAAANALAPKPNQVKE